MMRIDENQRGRYSFLLIARSNFFLLRFQRRHWQVRVRELIPNYSFPSRIQRLLADLVQMFTFCPQGGVVPWSERIEEKTKWKLFAFFKLWIPVRQWDELKIGTDKVEKRRPCLILVYIKFLSRLYYIIIIFVVYSIELEWLLNCHVRNYTNIRHNSENKDVMRYKECIVRYEKLEMMQIIDDRCTNLSNYIKFYYIRFITGQKNFI